MTPNTFNLQEYFQLSDKELEQFRSVAHQLMSHTFIHRSDYKNENERIRNPDYTFIVSHFEALEQYFSLLDWKLVKEDHNGYCYILHNSGTNRLSLTKDQTVLFLCLRLIYDEKIQDLGLENDVIISVQDILDKIITDFSFQKTYVKTKTKEDLSVAIQFRVLQKVKGGLMDTESLFALMPSILTVVPSHRVNALVQQLEKGEENETSQPSSTD